MNYSELLFALPSITDCIFMLLTISHMSGQKFKRTWHIITLLMIPSVIAVYIFTRFFRREAPLSILTYTTPLSLLTLALLLVFYSVFARYVSSGNLKKALFCISVSLLTVFTAAFLTLTVIFRFYIPEISYLLGDLDEYGILRITVSVVLFSIVNVIFADKVRLIIKKAAFTIISVIIIAALILSLTTDIVIDFSVAMIGSMIFVFLFAELAAIYAYLQKQESESIEQRFISEKRRFEENRFNDANAIWENVRRAQHDMKQHLTVISGYLDDGETEECKKYLTSIIPRVENMGNVVKSDNKIIDYLISSKLCSLKDTQVVISGSIGDLSDIEDADLSCLMGNIIDNAVEGVKSALDKRIELLFSRQNSNRIFICKNTVSESVLKNNPQLKTTKYDPKRHGYGTKIVSEIVEKYHGMIDYFEEYDMFGIQIVLPFIKN